MRFFTLVLVSVISLYANELIYISNNTSDDNLKELHEKYKQTLLINNSKIYLIPSDCRLQRYFGGASQGNMKFNNAPQQAQKIIITQDVFEAKDETAIKEKIELEKSISLIEGKVSKAFLDDKEGRGFGGASQIPLNFSFQQTEAKKIYMKPVPDHNPIAENAQKYQHPTCRLLDDGSGYKLQDIKNAQLYSKTGIDPIINSTILFE